MSAIHALFALATLAAPAIASAAPVEQTMAVDAGDLDLSSDKGQRMLAQRIQRAAEAMCRAEALESLPQHIRATRKCVQEARAGTDAAVKALIDTRALSDPLFASDPKSAPPKRAAHASPAARKR